jgi:HSP20 family protein
MAPRSTRKNPDQPLQTVAEFGLGGFLDGIQKLVEAASKLKESDGINHTAEFSVPGLGEKGKGIFGFSIRSMAGGAQPGFKIRPFGNIHKTDGGLSVEEDREPVVDVLEEAQQVRVIAELPGVAESDIAFELKGDVLMISTQGARRYHAEVVLPAGAAGQGIQSSYNNGVLELKLKKTAKG